MSDDYLENCKQDTDMKTIPTEVRYDGEQYVKLEAEFKRLEIRAKAAENDRRKLKAFIKLLSDHANVEFRANGLLLDQDDITQLDVIVRPMDNKVEIYLK